MAIAALVSFAILLVAWILAPDRQGAESPTAAALPAEPGPQEAAHPLAA